MNISDEVNPDNDESVEAVAAAWIAQRDEGFTEAQAAEFIRWKNSHPSHAAALAMVEKTWGIFEKMPQVRTDPKLFRDLGMLRRPGHPRRNLLRWCVQAGIAAAACIVLTFVAWRVRPDSAVVVQTYTTAEHGYDRVTLPDGSVVELNRATVMKLRFSAKERQVALTEGEAHFTVAKNVKRPFVVTIGKIAVRAVGTAFNVRVARESVEVIVTEGKVQIGEAEKLPSVAVLSANPDESPVYKAGQYVVVPVAIDLPVVPVVVAPDPGAIRARLSWQGARLVFRETPLSEVVEQFNRHNQIQLSIGDPHLAGRPVGGSFRPEQVESFVQLLEDTREIAVERVGANHLVLRATR